MFGVLDAIPKHSAMIALLVNKCIDASMRFSHDYWRNADIVGRSMSAYRPEGKVLHGTICADQIRIDSDF